MPLKKFLCTAYVAIKCVSNKITRAANIRKIDASKVLWGMVITEFCNKENKKIPSLDWIEC